MRFREDAHLARRPYEYEVPKGCVDVGTLLAGPSSDPAGPPYLYPEVADWLKGNARGEWRQCSRRITAISNHMKAVGGAPLKHEIRVFVIEFDDLTDEVMFRLRWTGGV